MDLSNSDPVLAVLLAIEVIERAPDAQADRLVRACLNRLGASEVGMIPREASPESVRRLGQQLTVADCSRQPDPGGRWVLGGPGASIGASRLAIDLLAARAAEGEAKKLVATAGRAVRAR
jgi:hypothetical protein